ncbi:MAG TPA: alpha/beta fold hydrolase [Woeseiaceae bacterium]|nr:alpha/beta fold hydrolase [Woeseiaceae bacterium]
MAGVHRNPRRIVFVHGIWVPAMQLRVLAKRMLAEHGFDGLLFDYASVRGSLDDNAALLAEFIAQQDPPGVHVVGHSLGGIVALRMLRNHADAGVARVVCLGSPLNGSRAAAALTRHRWGRALAGRTLSGGVLDEPASTWAAAALARCEVGSIAGTMAIGAGRLLTAFGGDNDGTVAVAETRLPGLRDHLCLPVNHTGLVLSANVAAQIAAFLERGRFLEQ